MRKLGLLAAGALLFSCSSTKDAAKERNLAAANSEPFVSKEDYYKHRGQDEYIKFKYDGYEAQLGLFGSTFVKPFDGRIGLSKAGKKNLEFLRTGTALRQNLFENNLIDTGTDQVEVSIDCEKIMYMPRRTPDGTCYLYGIEDKLHEQDKHLAKEIYMGAINQRFGRNTSPAFANYASKQDMMDPNPFEISQRLFTRKEGKTKEATIINVLAAAWLQAMNHDWFTHGKNSKKRSHTVEGYSGHKHFNKGSYKIPATRSESEKEASLDSNGYDYTSRNQVTHWWDASQIYGSDEATIKKVRTAYKADGTSTGKLLANGKIAVDEKNRRLIYDMKSELPITGFHDNWWLGLELIHTIFHMEHNKIIDNVLMPQVKKGTFCKGLGKTECDNKLFEVARLINSALIAKIHTVEWTPALLNHPMLHIAMRANWFGLRETFGGDSEKLRSKIGLGFKHVISGLVGKETLDLYKAPFVLTEEFVAVYRMPPLIPEHINYRSVKAPWKVSEKVDIKETVFRKANGLINTDKAEKGNSLDWMFSFGTSHPGGMLLNNYPTFMSNFVAERNTGSKHGDSARIDMGAIDILRDRERGVPRYNDFRRALGLPPAEKFEDLTENEEELAALKDIYNGDIEKVDLLVGTLAEKDRYPGYAFGNTPFWIFAIMASRRLMADPFFSDYYTDEVYTKEGIEYVNNRSMVDVVVDHYPELENKFYKTSYKYQKPGSKIWYTRKDGIKRPGDRVRRKQIVKNAFRPWRPVYEKVEDSL